MGFVQKKGGGDDGGPGGAGLEMDLDLHACDVCGRELLPWQSTCPDDGGRAVPKSGMAPGPDPHAEHLARLLADLDTGEQRADEPPSG